MPLHVRQARDAAAGAPWLRPAVGDARDLDLDDASVDAALLPGPLYHLRSAPTGSGRWPRPGGWSGRAARC
jgi:hypothetical protein